MSIPYTLLEHNKQGWTDGLHWLEDLEAWSLQYEKAYMVPAESNNKLARITLDLALYKLPSALHGIGCQYAAALLELRLRKAMM